MFFTKEAVINGTIVAACAVFGVSLSLYLDWPWFYGLATCSLLGYLLIEPINAYQKVGSAYKATMDWQPDKVFWSAVFWFLIACTLWEMYLGIVIYFSPNRISWSIDYLVVDSVKFLLYAMILCVTIFLSVIPLILVLISISEKNVTAVMITDITKAFCRYCNPLALVFYWPYRCIITSPKWFPEAFRLIVSMTKSLVWFVLNYLSLIHSSKRVLCVIDITIAFAIGIYFQAVLIALVSGLMIGLIHTKYNEPLGKKLALWAEGVGKTKIDDLFRDFDTAH